MYNPFAYTVESVTSGHPDKICDQISDAILDECLKQDPKSRVAIEVFGSHGLLVIGGEITSRAQVDFADVARKVYQGIGYKDDLKITVNVVQQSPDIAQGVDGGGAGDQGIMYGYATDETPEFLPQGIVLAHQLTSGLDRLRKEGIVRWLRPDGKAQVTVEDGKSIKILVSTQHSIAVSQAEVRDDLLKRLIIPLAGDISNTDVLINPTGLFTLGGFTVDTGLTGRKLMVDTYGGFVPHGGGSFSGKDATKVDRSAAYMARFAAKNIVANGLAKRCLVSVAYAIGKAEPLMLRAADEKDNDLSSVLKRNFDFRPQAIIERLQLRAPQFLQTATYGHFGKAYFPWEQVMSMA